MDATRGGGGSRSHNSYKSVVFYCDVRSKFSKGCLIEYNDDAEFKSAVLVCQKCLYKLFRPNLMFAKIAKNNHFCQKWPQFIFDAMILFQELQNDFVVFLVKTTFRIPSDKKPLCSKNTKNYNFLSNMLIYRFFFS